ncbi:MAG: PD-(D/E)XK nuclease-like domain-containing protein, partial [Rhodocyclaceae bacterium]|nr:PD-(D/E)XK nuclease-like domain-containing protein [Rhodocyclaceae bacterium]
MLSAEPVKEEAESQEATKRPFIEAGWHRDLDNDAYHGSSGWSSSQLKTLIERTPAHLVYNMTHRSEPTANMALGTAVHTLVLEPATFDAEFAVMPKVDKRTKIGKEMFAEFEAASAGKTVIAEDMLAKAQAMADSVRSHPVAGLLLEDVVSESSIYWWYKTMDPDD